MFTFLKRIALWVLVAIIAAPLLIACTSTSTTTSSCGFIVGDGSNNGDAKLHKVVYSGQSTHVGDHENISYVPCNSRNYIINDGSVKNANGDKVGDRFTLITATTKSGVPITIAATGLWTLNQSDKALRDFYTVCFKYTCASNQDKGGGANFSTPGWNGMLAENFGPTMDRVARIAAIKADDSIWTNHDPAKYKALADDMSAAFADAMRANLGYPEDLFCGSGNSRWNDPDKPGEGDFTCSPVRITVDDVQRGNVKSDENTQGAVSLNTQRLKNAQALYGPDAGYWLALQDVIDKCGVSKATCIFNIGGSTSSPAVPVPVTTPVPPR